MTEFKNVTWGEGTPVDYQRLGAMMNNDQYLKDLADKAPRGILMHKTRTQFSFNPTGAIQNVSGYTNLTFTTEANRSIEMIWAPGIMTANSVTSEARYWFLLDGATYGVTGTIFETVSATTTASPLIYPAHNLTAGTHTLTVQMIASSGISNLSIGDFGSSVISVKDIGKSIPPTP